MPNIAPKIPICFPKIRPRATPKTTGCVKSATPNPPRLTPALKKAKIGTITKLTQLDK